MKFIVQAKATLSCQTIVEAESEEEALEIAKHREISALCHGPFIDEVDESFHIEIDGEASELEAYPYDGDED